MTPLPRNVVTSHKSLSVCREFGFIDDPKRDKNPTRNREVLCAECVRANENQLPVARDQKVSENETVAPTRRRHTGGRAGVAAGERLKR
jgi:hypothetical protein